MKIIPSFERGYHVESKYIIKETSFDIKKYLQSKLVLDDTFGFYMISFK